MESLAKRLMYARTRRGLSQAELAKLATVSQGTIGNIESGARKRPREILAIAQALDVRPEWLQDGQGQMEASYTGTGNDLPVDTHGIPLLDARASMGNGKTLVDHVEVIEMVSANLVELRRLLSFSAPSNLRILAGIGESMAPTINDGDLLLIDVGVTDIKLDAVYVLQKEDELFIKRMQRHPAGGYVMRSDNPLYESYPISNPAAQGFQVLARVLCVWNMRKL
jgi:phage repressor protein C with HTH and peptisase S24 domain